MLIWQIETLKSWVWQNLSDLHITVMMQLYQVVFLSTLCYIVLTQSALIFTYNPRWVAQIISEEKI